jgi:adenine-specific DNA-methyltransferase
MNENSELGQSLDMKAEKRRQLMAVVPEAFTEGRLDIAALKRSVGDESVIEAGERYALTWAGKGDAYKVLQAPATATLRPQRDLSVNFDEAQHVFIEGENLEALKALQKAYFGKVKLIYIDPPYNTGSDSFIYPDRFQESKEDYLKRINDLTDDGSLMREGFFRKNAKESGHYHSNWLSMMLPRLYIARNLMSEDGVILVSIDDNEDAGLKLLMDEIFGPENFIAQLVWEKGRKNDAKLFSVGHEYMLVYARSLIALRDAKTVWREPKPGAKEIITKWRELRKQYGEKNYEDQQKALRDWYAALPVNDPSRKLSRYKWVDKWGPWRDRDISWPGGGGPRYDVPHEKTKQPCKIPEAGWRFSTPEEMQRQIRLGLVEFREDHTEPPFRKAHLLPVPEELDEEDTMLADALESEQEQGEEEEVGLQVLGSVLYKQSQVAVKHLRKLLGGTVFNNPKDHEILERLIRYCVGEDQTGIVMDFFAGSGSTVEAVLSLNQNEGTALRVIAVQLPEACDEDSPAAKIGFVTIADMCRKRIRRVIDALNVQFALTDPSVRNVGFKSFLLAPSNFKQWRGDGIEDAEALAAQLQMFVSGEKPGATPEDMLFELLLKFGQPLTVPIERLAIGDATVYAINNRAMVFILERFTLDMIEPLLALKPREVVAIDAVFHDSDELKTNLDLQCRDAEVRFTCI